MLKIYYDKEKCRVDIFTLDLNAKIYDENITDFKLYETDDFVDFTLILDAEGFKTGNYHGVFSVSNNQCCNVDAYYGNGFTKRVNVSCGGYTYKYCNTPPTTGIFVFRIMYGLYKLEVFDSSGNKVYNDDWKMYSYNRTSNKIHIGCDGCGNAWHHQGAIIKRLLFYDRFLTDEEVMNVVGALSG